MRFFTLFQLIDDATLIESEFGLASTITLVLQANQITKCGSHTSSKIVVLKKSQYWQENTSTRNLSSFVEHLQTNFSRLALNG